MKKSHVNKILYIVLLFGLSFVYYQGFINAQDTLISRLEGKILLQVEQNGEAWYVYPPTDERHYLGRPDDAFALMKNFGIGISNNDLAKIPLAVIDYAGPDSDQDGLSDLLEDSLDLDKTNQDSDGDGFSDLEEVASGYNPLGQGSIELDLALANNFKGFILLQVEQNGEAWYINPDDQKRYFLGRPADAFTVMKKTGLGISDNNIGKIAQYNPRPASTLVNTAPVDNSKRKYTDSSYSFEYPKEWKLSKTDGKKENIFLRNYENDIIDEEKAYIIISQVDTSEAVELDKFKTANKNEATKLSSQEKAINQFEALEEVFDYQDIDSREISTFVKLSDTSILRVTLFSAGNHQYHESILGDVLRSIKKPE